MAWVRPGAEFAELLLSFESSAWRCQASDASLIGEKVGSSDDSKKDAAEKPPPAMREGVKTPELDAAPAIRYLQHGWRV